MKTKCSVITAFCIAVAVHLTFIGGGGRAFAADEWTVMVYLDGDCSLEDAAIGDFLEMSDAGSTSDVNILVLFDRISGYSGAYDDWTGARRGLLEKNDDPYAAWGVDMGELNMGASPDARRFRDLGCPELSGESICRRAVEPWIRLEK